MHPAFALRRATPKDADVLVSHRRWMFEAMGHQDVAALEAMTAAFRPWLLRKMESGEYLAWLAEAQDGSIAAGAGLWLMDWTPHLIAPTKPRANILNVYTHPDYRRQGLAKRLIETAVEWCREHEIRVVILHASDAGRLVYSALGFRPTNEMRILLDPS